MSVDYSTIVGYGVVIKGDNLARLREVIPLPDDRADFEIADLLFEQPGVSSEGLNYDYTFDQMSGNGEPGVWFAAKANVLLNGEVRDSDAGLHTFAPIEADPNVDAVRRWLEDRQIGYEGPIYFYGVSIL